MIIFSEAASIINTFFETQNKLPLINADLYQGIFIKQLSNSNLVYSKKYMHKIDAHKTNQSHIDLPSRNSIDFFFGELKDDSVIYKQISLDIPSGNLDMLAQLDNPMEYLFNNSRGAECIGLKRTISSQYKFTQKDYTYISGYAYKKAEGHNGSQGQINRLNNHDVFFELLSHAYQNDFLIFLKYALEHYLVFILPEEFSSKLKKIMGREKNLAISNPSYNKENATTEYQKFIEENLPKEVEYIKNNIENDNTLNGHDKQILIKGRIGQGAFRQQLINNSGCKCQLCDITVPSTLRASHIKGWADSNSEERMDVDNGLLLCANHDAIFDRHEISFEPQTGNICISPNLTPIDQVALNISPDFALGMTPRMTKYLKYHHAIYNAQNNNE